MTACDPQGNLLEPGTVVLGPFYSDGREGVGVVVKRGRELWTRVPDEYVPVRPVKGDRVRCGYRPVSLTVVR